MSRSWVFTINNYSEELLKKLSDPEFWGKNECVRYVIFGKEVGEKCKTPHLQGYIELNKPQRLVWMQAKCAMECAHLEKRLGTRTQAREYCMKEDKSPFEFGDWNAGGQGRRTDITKVLNAAKEGKTLLEIINEFPVESSRNLRLLEKYISLNEKEETKEFRTVNVEVLVGDAGSGKTRTAHEYDKDIFTVDSDSAFPFDGYDGEKTILIDDFYGGIKYSSFLRILDGHQYRVNVKGSHRYAKWTKVFITSNQMPESWYQRGLTPALARRLTETRIFGPVMSNEVEGNSNASTSQKK